MLHLSPTIEQSSLWQSSMSSISDNFSAERERLRASFIAFRSNVSTLANEIRKDAPELTVHDITHLDAIWETASMIVGNDYKINPAEAFVLGGAILLHDLAMSLASIEGGIKSLKKDHLWSDLVTREYGIKYQRKPSTNEIDNPEEQIRNTVIFNVLRQTHARNAENLAFLSFKSTSGEPIFLIDNIEIRQSFGRIIGEIAHSHWWSVTDVENKLSKTLGAPHWCPSTWTIDSIKLAAILRVSDAAQIDGRRAPTFLKSITNLSSTSNDHWTFQEKLNKAYLKDDALTFTSGDSFILKEAASWWLCLETLKIIDKELRDVDSLLSEKNIPRFSAKRVTGIDSPEHLIRYIPTAGWLPINATIHVTDLPKIVKSLGGEELYGSRPIIPLRELIQNACDAIRAKRTYEDRPENYGKVSVSISDENSNSHWLQVKDDGIGMSQRVLTEVLLNFGTSFWQSPLIQQEFPGLLTKGIKATGKYGIGFFSVFMLADHVKIITRRSDAARKDTLVLEFLSGVNGRPILRPANDDEILLDGGTIVHLTLRENPRELDGLLSHDHEDITLSLSQICQKIAPALDVNLETKEGNITELIVSANDWKTIPAEELLDRVGLNYQISEKTQSLLQVTNNIGNNLRFLKDEDGNITGRACLIPSFSSSFRDGDHYPLGGVITVGGLTATYSEVLCGVIEGRVVRAARDSALPLVDDSNLINWATEQADLVKSITSDKDLLHQAASTVIKLGGDPKDLPIAINRKKWLSSNNISDLPNLDDHVILINKYSAMDLFKHFENYELLDEVFILDFHQYIPIIGGESTYRWPKKSKNYWSKDSPPTDIVGHFSNLISKKWNCPIEDLISFNNLAKTYYPKPKEMIIGVADNKKLKFDSILINKPK